MKFVKNIYEFLIYISKSQNHILLTLKVLFMIFKCFERIPESLSICIHYTSKVHKTVYKRVLYLQFINCILVI